MTSSIRRTRSKTIGLQGSVTGAVTGKHLKWLDHVLSEARRDSSIKHIFVQAHLPVLLPVRRVNSSGMLMDDEMESDFWQTLRKHKVDIYFAGEVHSNTATKDPKSDLVQIVTRAKFMNRGKKRCQEPLLQSKNRCQEPLLKQERFLPGI